MSTARDTITGLDPELALIAAVLHQAVHDARSARAAIRDEALQFLADEEALRWWSDVLDLGDALAQQVQAVLRHGR